MKPLKNKAHLARVAELPCCITGRHPVEVHHIRVPGVTGIGQKASDFFTIPLTPDMHREFHRMGRANWERVYGHQIRHVATTLDKLYG